VSSQVYYNVKDEVIFVKGKAIIFSIAIAMVKIINPAIGKKNLPIAIGTCYIDNIFELTLIKSGQVLV